MPEERCYCPLVDLFPKCLRVFTTHQRLSICVESGDSLFGPKGHFLGRHLNQQCMKIHLSYYVYTVGALSRGARRGNTKTLKDLGNSYDEEHIHLPSLY